jgi:hypothetical protein
MKQLLLISAFLAAPALTPALGQDQGDPNPPAVQENGRPVPLSPKVAGLSGLTRMSKVIPHATPSPSGGDTSGPAAGGTV